MNKGIFLPEERYNNMVASYDAAMSKIEDLQREVNHLRREAKPLIFSKSLTSEGYENLLAQSQAQFNRIYDLIMYVVEEWELDMEYEHGTEKEVKRAEKIRVENGLLHSMLDTAAELAFTGRERIDTLDKPEQ